MRRAALIVVWLGCAVLVVSRKERGILSEPRFGSSVSRGPAAGVGVVAVLCLVQFVDVLGVTETVTALPSILRGLDASRAAGSLVLTAYAMSFGGFLMLGARLGDRFGHRQVLLAGLTVFVAASVLCATAAWPAVLIVGRGVQGVAAAASVPATLRLLTAITVPGSQRDRAVALWSASGALAGASGLLLGGVLTELAGWRTVFWVNAPVAVFLGGVVRRYAPGLEGTLGRALDLRGAILLSATVMLLVLATSLLQPPVHLVLGVGSLAGCVICACGLVWAERCAVDPLLRPEIFTNHHLRSGARSAFANTAATSSTMALATLQLQRIDHVGPASAGLRLIPFSLGVILGSRLAASFLARAARPTVIAIGLAAIAAGNLILAMSDGTGAALPVSVAISGLGIGVSSVAATSLAIDVPATLQATAAGATNTAAQLGTALGVATLLLLAALTNARWGWAGASAIALATSVIALRDRISTP